MQLPRGKESPSEKRSIATNDRHGGRRQLRAHIFKSSPKTGRELEIR